MTFQTKSKISTYIILISLHSKMYAEFVQGESPIMCTPLLFYCNYSDFDFKNHILKYLVTTTVIVLILFSFSYEIAR